MAQHPARLGHQTGEDSANFGGVLSNGMNVYTIVAKESKHEWRLRDLNPHLSVDVPERAMRIG